MVMTGSVRAAGRVGVVTGPLQARARSRRYRRNTAAAADMAAVAVVAAAMGAVDMAAVDTEAAGAEITSCLPRSSRTSADTVENPRQSHAAAPFRA